MPAVLSQTEPVLLLDRWVALGGGLSELSWFACGPVLGTVVLDTEDPGIELTATNEGGHSRANLGGNAQK